MKKAGISPGVAVASLVVGILIGAGATYVASQSFNRVGAAETFTMFVTRTFFSNTTITQPAVTATSTQTVYVTTVVTFTVTKYVSISYVAIVPGAGVNQSSAGYYPETLVLVLGVNNTVTWRNKDSVPHTVSSAPSDQPFESGNLDAGHEFTFTFTKSGTYIYYCLYHSWMHGKVIVKSP